MKKIILTIIITIIVTMAIMSGLVFLCMYNPFIGVSVIVLFCLALFLFPSYKLRKLNTVEKYIASKNHIICQSMQKIHELILEIVPDAVPVIDKTFLFPTYLYAQDDQFYNLISQQAIIGGKSICIYPHNPLIFEVFSDRIQNYKNNGRSEILLPADKSLDLDLIRDILIFKVNGEK